MMTTPVEADGFLESGGYIEADHPRIRALVAAITADLVETREKAVRIHDFVRDEVDFGWTSSFYRMPATDVLESGVGYCNTKATLFIAMLRAAGIPARQRFVDISSEVLRGFLTRGNPYLDHSYTEVYLDGRWLGVDSYVVDLPLFRNSQRLLAQSGMKLGYGIHTNGVPTWDGRSDSFIQFVNDGSVPSLTTRDHGVFADVEEFYREVDGHDKLSGLNRFLIPLFIPRSTAKVRDVRRERGWGADQHR